MPSPARAAAATSASARGRRSSFAIAVAFGVTALAALMASACPGTPLPVGKPSSCGNRCADLTCPPGSRCTMTGNCSAYCEQETLERRF